jgi:hypothetical protein
MKITTKNKAISIQKYNATHALLELLLSLKRVRSVRMYTFLGIVVLVRDKK